MPPASLLAGTRGALRCWRQERHNPCPTRDTPGACQASSRPRAAPSTPPTSGSTAAALSCKPRTARCLPGACWALEDAASRSKSPAGMQDKLILHPARLRPLDVKVLERVNVLAHEIRASVGGQLVLASFPPRLQRSWLTYCQYRAGKVGCIACAASGWRNPDGWKWRSSSYLHCMWSQVRCCQLSQLITYLGSGDY